MDTTRFGSITGRDVIPCLGSRETIRLGSFTERNKSAMPYRTLHSSVPSVQCFNTLKSPYDPIKAVSYSGNLEVKYPPYLEKRKQQQARRGLNAHSDRPSTQESAEANYVRYLKEKGYGAASIQEVREQQAKLGLFRANHVPLECPDDSFGVSSETSCIRYLKEKGYGLANLEEVKDLQAKLGLFHSGPVSCHEGERGQNVSRGDVTKRGLQ